MKKKNLKSSIISFLVYILIFTLCTIIIMKFARYDAISSWKKFHPEISNMEYEYLKLLDEYLDKGYALKKDKNGVLHVIRDPNNIMKNKY